MSNCSWVSTPSAVVVIRRLPARLATACTMATDSLLLSDKPLNGLETPFDWAFSFWGGSFYFYTMPDETVYPNRTTNVTKYDPGTGALDTSYMTNIGFRIVGAGVSTCAPIKPPA